MYVMLYAEICVMYVITAKLDMYYGNMNLGFPT